MIASHYGTVFWKLLQSCLKLMYAKNAIEVLFAAIRNVEQRLGPVSFHKGV